MTKVLYGKYLFNILDPTGENVVKSFKDLAVAMLKKIS